MEYVELIVYGFPYQFGQRPDWQNGQHAPERARQRSVVVEVSSAPNLHPGEEKKPHPSICIKVSFGLFLFLNIPREKYVSVKRNDRFLVTCIPCCLLSSFPVAAAAATLSFLLSSVCTKNGTDKVRIGTQILKILNSNCHCFGVLAQPT